MALKILKGMAEVFRDEITRSAMSPLKRLLLRGWEWLLDTKLVRVLRKLAVWFIVPVYELVKRIVGRIFDKSIGMTMYMAKFALVAEAFIGLASLITTAISLYFMLDSAFDLGRMVINPSGVITSQLREILSMAIGSGGIGGVLSAIDNLLAGATAGYISPSLTLSGLFCSLGIAQMWNAVFSSAISGFTFAVSVWLLKWSSQRLKFSWVRKLK